MTNTWLQKRVLIHLRNQKPKDFYLALGFSILAVVLHTCALITEFTRIAEFRTLTSPTITYVFMLIELALIVSVLGLWSRKRTGLVTSIIALLCVGVGYGLWYVYSRQTLDFLLSKSFYQLHPETLPQYPLGLIQATWLNLVVLVISGVLCVWNIRVLRSMSKTRT